jgi:hypothetical protein
VYDLPIYVWALVLAGVIGIPAFTSAVLYRGAVAAGLSLPMATAVTPRPLSCWAAGSWSAGC